MLGLLMVVFGGAIITALVDKYVLGISFDEVGNAQRVVHVVIYLLWGGLLYSTALSA